MDSNLDIVKRRHKYSCWDVLDPTLLNSAERIPDRQIYVHGEILEWIVLSINENILDEHLRATVEEVHHHNLDGPVYLINFYSLDSSHTNILMNRLDRKLDAIKARLRYKMPWKTNPTYFLRIDSKFKDKKHYIKTKLKKFNVPKCFRVTTLAVNWLYIPKIEIYEVVRVLSAEEMAKIDSIFYKRSRSRAEIYIADQFVWHRNVSSYIEVDKVAMDMCAEEWRRYDLLKYFSIDEILHLDLANKDYRDPYMNEYLDRYLNILLYKSLPQLSSNQAQPLDVPMINLHWYERNYFVSRFYNKITNLCFPNMRFSEYLYNYDIPRIELVDKSILLRGNSPSIDQLLNLACNGSISYKISNYDYFSNTLFRTLLNKFNNHQSYKVRFDQEFRFTYEKKKQFSNNPPLIKLDNWTSESKKIKIELKNCVEHNADELVRFVKYLISLFNELKGLHVEVSLRFTNCTLEDYSFLKGIGKGIDIVQFKSMNISSQQIKVLGRVLTQQTSIKFFDCSQITDSNVMTLLENIDFHRIWIEGNNACTPAIYFLMAEHLMNAEGVDTIEANRFNENMWYTKYNFYYHFDKVEFFKNGNQIVARNRQTKEIVDLFYLMVKKDILLQPRNVVKLLLDKQKQISFLN